MKLKLILNLNWLQTKRDIAVFFSNNNTNNNNNNNNDNNNNSADDCMQWCRPV